MKKRTSLQIIVILLIGFMLILSCHTHPYRSPWDSDDDHCLLCHILHSGFTFNLAFKLILLIILIGIIIPSQANTVKTRPQTGYDNRAPPIAFLFL